MAQSIHGNTQVTAGETVTYTLSNGGVGCQTVDNLTWSYSNATFVSEDAYSITLKFNNSGSANISCSFVCVTTLQNRTSNRTITVSPPPVPQNPYINVSSNGAQALFCNLVQGVSYSFGATFSEFPYGYTGIFTYQGASGGCQSLPFPYGGILLSVHISGTNGGYAQYYRN
ncbi:MAG: hypothetical protein EAZ97_01300 [Bacteroidetes bacterium]|nr:MAG: hypothetical protein EAZ97_01300 [Bacteroidota bacterium]